MIRMSILVPVYNGSRFITRLFQSLILQNIDSDEYEIVCLDDCSTDDSLRLIREYQQEFSNIRLLKNSTNCGVATSVNKLINNAKGRFFWIVGQDDYIKTNCLKMLCEKMETDSLDVLLFNYQRVRENESLIDECLVFTCSPVLKGIDFIKTQFDIRDYCKYILGYEWRAIYRTDYWRSRRIECIDGMNYEDTVIMMKAIVYSNAVESIDDCLYYYRINSASITFCEDYNKKGNLIFEFAFVVGDEVEQFYKDLYKIDESLSKQLLSHMKARYNSFVLDLIRTNSDNKKKFYQLVCDNRSFVDSKRTWLVLKSRVLLSPVVGYPIACMLGRIYRINKRFFHGKGKRLYS